jgi:hypothetical protein
MTSFQMNTHGGSDSFTIQQRLLGGPGRMQILVELEPEAEPGEFACAVDVFAEIPNSEAPELVRDILGMVAALAADADFREAWAAEMTARRAAATTDGGVR